MILYVIIAFVLLGNVIQYVRERQFINEINEDVYYDKYEVE